MNEEEKQVVRSFVEEFARMSYEDPLGSLSGKLCYQNLVKLISAPSEEVSGKPSLQVMKNEAIVAFVSVKTEGRDNPLFVSLDQVGAYCDGHLFLKMIDGADNAYYHIKEESRKFLEEVLRRFTIKPDPMFLRKTT